MPAVSRMATVLRSSVLVLFVIQPRLREARGVAHDARDTFVGARAFLDPTYALLAADGVSSQRRLCARLRRRVRPRGGNIARRRLAIPAAGRTRIVLHSGLLMAPVSPCVGARADPESKFSLCSPLTVAQASASSALG